MANNPLNPSIKLDPLTTNKKQIKTNIKLNILFSNQRFKKTKPVFSIFILKKIILMEKIKIIKINLMLAPI